MKTMMLLVIFALCVSCGKSSGKKSKNPSIVIEPEPLMVRILEDLVYPAGNQLEYNGELIVDLSQSGAVVSSYGEVQRGRTLNQLIIEGRELLVYGEDGVFAVECEPNAAYPSHGPTHPKCQVAHGENFDQIILCASRTSTTPVMTAQNWPGYPTAMTDDSLGLECWVNGEKMLSNKIFTY